MVMVKNKYGNDIDFEVAVSFMDDRLREYIAGYLAPCTQQAFFTEYCNRHKVAFKEDFYLDT